MNQRVNKDGKLKCWIKKCNSHLVYTRIQLIYSGID